MAATLHPSLFLVNCLQVSTSVVDILHGFSSISTAHRFWQFWKILTSIFFTRPPNKSSWIGVLFDLLVIGEEMPLATLTSQSQSQHRHFRSVDHHSCHRYFSWKWKSQCSEIHPGNETNPRLRIEKSKLTSWEDEAKRARPLSWASLAPLTARSPRSNPGTNPTNTPRRKYHRQCLLDLLYHIICHERWGRKRTARGTQKTR